MNAITLRPYQEEAVQTIIAACAATGRGLLTLATGGGKTIIFSEIIRRAGMKTLIIAHRQELLDQAQAKIIAVMPGADTGIVSGTQKEWGRTITIGSVQTLVRNLARVEQEQFDVVIVDEAHHATAKSYRQVLKATPGAWCIGVTATPDRLDKANIAEIFGPVVYERDIIELIEDGWLCDLQGIRVRSAIWLNSVKKNGDDYKADELANAVNVSSRNLMIVKAYMERAMGLPAICFAVNVEHAKTLATTFQQFDVRACALDGSASKEERETVLAAYHRGDIQVLVNCQLFTEGFDAPHTACIIMARPTLSRALYCQMIGRGTRTHPGKERCIILDITDNTTKHALQAVNFARALDAPVIHGASADATLKELLALAREQKEQRERALREHVLREQERLERMQREQKERELAEQRLAFTAVNLLGQHKEWRGNSADGAFTMRVTSTTALRIERRPDWTYNVIEANSFLGKASRIAIGVSLEEAQHIAQERAQQVIALIKERVAATADAPATERQIETMRRMRLHIPMNCTKGQAQDMIAEKVAALSAQRA